MSEALTDEQYATTRKIMGRIEILSCCTDKGLRTLFPEIAEDKMAGIRLAIDYILRK